MSQFRKMIEMAVDAIFLLIAVLMFPFASPIAMAQATMSALKGVVPYLNRIIILTLTMLLALGPISSMGLARSMPAMFTFAQGSNTGRLVGTVLSPDGAAILGADIVVTDNQTAKGYAVTTSDEGSFTMPQLEVGTYTVTVTAQGFKTFTATALKVDVGN